MLKFGSDSLKNIRFNIEPVHSWISFMFVRKIHRITFFDDKDSSGSMDNSQSKLK